MSTLYQDAALARWRTLREALTATYAETEAEYVRRGAEAFETYRAAMPAKKRSKMPGPPTTASELSRMSEVWHSMLTAEAREEIRPALEMLIGHLRAADERVVAARRALREAARTVPAAVVGDGAAWRMIRADWLAQHGGNGAARSAAELTAHDLLHLGYQVRCHTRLHPEGMTRPIRAFEVWAWTCEDGAEIARCQVPTGEVAEPPIRWVPIAADAEVLP